MGRKTDLHYRLYGELKLIICGLLLAGVVSLVIAFCSGHYISFFIALIVLVNVFRGTHPKPSRYAKYQQGLQARRENAIRLWQNYERMFSAFGGSLVAIGIVLIGYGSWRPVVCGILLFACGVFTWVSDPPAGRDGEKRKRHVPTERELKKAAVAREIAEREGAERATREREENRAWFLAAETKVRVGQYRDERSLMMQKMTMLQSKAAASAARHHKDLAIIDDGRGRSSTFTEVLKLSTTISSISDESAIKKEIDALQQEIDAREQFVRRYEMLEAEFGVVDAIGVKSITDVVVDGAAPASFCTECGTARAPGAKFCGNCGHRFE